MQITLEQALTLCALVDYGGYSKAAEKIHKSHTSLVYSIKTLEEQCGFPLFNRSQYKNTLTPAGHRVYLKCQELLTKLDELRLICSQLNESWEPSLKIVFDGITPIRPFLDIYKKFQSEKIPTRVQTYTNYLQDVENSFHTLDADIMISVLPAKQKNLNKIYLPPFHIHLVAHKDHPLSKSKKNWTLQQLQEFYFLTVRSTQNDLKLNTEELEQDASFNLSDFSFKKEAIMKKVGFGWLPDHLIEHELKNRTLIPLKWERKNQTEIQPILYTKSELKAGKATQIIMNILSKNY